MEGYKNFALTYIFVDDAKIYRHIEGHDWLLQMTNLWRKLWATETLPGTRIIKVPVMGMNGGKLARPPIMRFNIGTKDSDSLAKTW